MDFKSIKSNISKYYNTAKKSSLGIKLRRKISKYKPFPYITTEFNNLEMEATTFCNRKCTYCPNSQFERFGPEEDFYMPDPIFEKIISDLALNNYSGIIAPHHYGEPLSDPSIYEKIKFINRKIPNAKIKIVTNGDYLNSEIYQKLLDYGISILNISKHSKKLEPECNELLDKIKTYPEKHRVKPMVFDFWGDYMKDQESLFNRGGSIKKIKKAQHKPIKCVYASYPVINVYGDMILCCQDYESKYILGNVMQTSIYEIWRNPENMKLRERIMRSSFDIEICQNCLFTTV